MSDQSSDKTSSRKQRKRDLSVVDGGRDELEKTLVEDLFRPNNSESQLDDLAKRLSSRGSLKSV